jgi:hypothetical protein
MNDMKNELHKTKKNKPKSKQKTPKYTNFKKKIDDLKINLQKKPKQKQKIIEEFNKNLKME